MYYSVEEMTVALGKATQVINDRTKSLENYTRGTNDCLALLIEYDVALRGDKSKARDYIDFEWKTTKEFMVKLLRSGKSIEEFAIFSNYELVLTKRPRLGDIAFNNGAMICDGSFWVSTNENNTGVERVKQIMFLETRIPLIARPLRS